MKLIRARQAIEEYESLVKNFDVNKVPNKEFFLREYLTKTMFQKYQDGYIYYDEAIEKSLKKYHGVSEKKAARYKSHILQEENCNLADYKIIVRYTRSGRPIANLQGSNTTSSCRGGGYDFLSTVVGDVINKSHIRYLFYEYLENNDTIKAYGINGYRVDAYSLRFPQISLGIGVGCYPEIFKEIGVSYKHEQYREYDIFDFNKGE